MTIETLTMEWGQSYYSGGEGQTYYSGLLLYKHDEIDKHSVLENMGMVILYWLIVLV